MSSFWKGTFKLVLWVGGILLVIGGLLRATVVRPITAGHDGMAPTFIAGEKVLLWEGDSFDMGDMVVCEHPSQPGSMVMGRVMGKPGMSLETNERGTLTIEGTPVDTDWQGETTFFDTGSNSEQTMRRGLETVGNTEHAIFLRDGSALRLRVREIGGGKLYLLGDNRADRVHDSRAFGPVSQETCLGTIFMRWSPAERGAALDHGWLDLLQ